MNHILNAIYNRQVVKVSRHHAQPSSGSLFRVCEGRQRSCLCSGEHSRLKKTISTGDWISHGECTVKEADKIYGTLLELMGKFSKTHCTSRVCSFAKFTKGLQHSSVCVHYFFDRIWRLSEHVAMVVVVINGKYPTLL